MNGILEENPSTSIKLSYKLGSNIKRSNENINVVFMNQPVGMGYSSANIAPENPVNLETKYIYDLIQIILTRYLRTSQVSLHDLFYDDHIILDWIIKIIHENDDSKIKSFYCFIEKYYD